MQVFPHLEKWGLLRATKWGLLRACFSERVVIISGHSKISSKYRR